MVKYVEAFKRPFQDLWTFVIGVVLMLIPGVNLLVTGYYVKCAKLTMEGKKELPKWENWTDIIVDSIKLLLIYFIYLIPTIIIAGVSMTTFLFSMVALVGSSPSGSDAAMPATAGVLLIGLLLVTITLITLYLLPIAMMRYVETGRARKALNVIEVIKKSLNTKYLVAWIITFFVSALIYAILTVTIIGNLFTPFIMAVAMSTIFAEVYMEIK